MPVLFKDDNVLDAMGNVLYGAGIVSGQAIAVNTLKNLFKTYSSIDMSVASDASTQPQRKSIREQYLFALRNMFVNTSLLLYSLSRYYFLNWTSKKPAAIIAGIPLGTVQELSHAMSQDQLKYRSKGGVFLAHQPGGEQSLRISGKSIGNNRYVFLTMVDFLFRFGNSTMMDMMLKRSDVTAMVSNNLVKNDLDVNHWQKFDELSMDTGREEFHYTFPIITRDRIYTNMYIETYEFTESIENGMSVISFTLFFRKFEQPFPHKYAMIPRNKSTKPDIFFYKENYDNETMEKLKTWDATLQFSLSSAIILMRVGTMLASNSPERTTALLFGMDLGVNNFSVDKNLLTTLSNKFDDIENGSDILVMTTHNKEEVMQID